MRIRKALATAAVLAAAIGPVLTASTASAGVVRPDAFACYGYGTGATHAEAAIAARQDMIGDVTIGSWVYTSGQYSDGTYWVQIAADCLYIQ